MNMDVQSKNKTRFFLPGVDGGRPPVRHIPWKRVFDVLFSLGVILILMPVYLTIGVGAALSTKGTPIYRQKRVGRGGRLFYCYKFRTMVPNADRTLRDLLERDEALRREWNESWKLKKDPRVTRFGKFLRKTSLDELPQFFNVLKGDLSVVGPRAVVVEEIETYFKEKASEILIVRPGITGLWQVSGRSDVSYSRRIQMDEKYVQNVSLALDIRIVVKTIPFLFNFKGGAY